MNPLHIVLVIVVTTAVFVLAGVVVWWLLTRPLRRDTPRTWRR